MARLRRARLPVSSLRRGASRHAWPIAAVFIISDPFCFSGLSSHAPGDEEPRGGDRHRCQEADAEPEQPRLAGEEVADQDGGTHHGHGEDCGRAASELMFGFGHDSKLSRHGPARYRFCTTAQNEREAAVAAIMARRRVR